MPFGQVTKIDFGELKKKPEWVPPDDSVFQYLLEEAAFGWVPVYFAALPLQRLRRFAPEFHPELTADGEKLVAKIMSDWRGGHFQYMWVYPRRELFVVSDDYFTLAAAERGQPDFVPCWVLGKPQEGTADQVQGPIRQSQVSEMLGLSPARGTHDQPLYDG